MTIAAIMAFDGGALSAVGTAAIFSAAAVVFALGLRPLVARALDVLDREPESLQQR